MLAKGSGSPEEGREPTPPGVGGMRWPLENHRRKLRPSVALRRRRPAFGLEKLGPPRCSVPANLNYLVCRLAMENHAGRASRGWQNLFFP